MATYRSKTEELLAKMYNLVRGNYFTINFGSMQNVTLRYVGGSPINPGTDPGTERYYFEQLHDETIICVFDQDLIRLFGKGNMYHVLKS